MKRCKYALSILLAVTSGLGAVRANQIIEISAPSESFRIRQVALFKNGLGFFLGQAECPHGRKEFQIDLPTAPAHGTFWIAHDRSVDLLGVVATETQLPERVSASSIPELLRANVGAHVSLTFGDREVTGIIEHVAEDRELPAPRPYSAGGRSERLQNPGLIPPQRARLMMLRTDSGTLCLNPDAITNVTFTDPKIQRTFIQANKAVRLNVRLKQAAPNQTIQVTYLAKGLTWSPSYMVDITKEERATVSAKALILNDACELNNVTVQLVTGFPHLQFSNTISPIAMKEDIAQFMQSLTTGQPQGDRYRAMDNILVQNVAYGGGAMMGGPGGPGMPAYGTAETGTVTEDLFLYPSGQIDLGRDEVAYIPLFTESIPYTHIYQWDIPDYVNEQDRYVYSPDQQKAPDVEEQVWHSLRLANTTKVPWTTAPAETIKNGMILGQDTLKYTPAGGEGTLRITRALGIKADQIEFETSRKRDAMQLYGYHYDLVTVKGELSAVNMQDKAVTLEITKTLSGEIQSIVPDARQDKLATGLRRMNGLTRLTWTVELAPAAEQKISYTYNVYVRR